MKKDIIYLVSGIMLFLFSACAAQRSGMVYLSNSRSAETNAPYFFDRDFDGEEIRLNAVKYKKGIVMISDSEIKFVLKKSYNEFNAIVGIGDKHFNYKTTLIFSVYGDGKMIYDSQPLGFGKVETINVSIKGIKELTLKVKSPAKEFTDFAIWADAYLAR